MGASGAEWVMSTQAKAVAAICSVIALCLSGFNIYKHTVNYNYPRTQRYIVRILFVIPVYSICSLISVSAPDIVVIIQTIRDVYEALVIYSFLSLILEYAGGDYRCVEAVKHMPPFPHPWPMNYCLPLIRRDGNLLRYCKQGTIQFVVCKPTMAVMSLIALGAGYYYTSGYQLTLMTIYNISYTIALYCLVLFYVATRSLLGPYKPILKFFAVKSIVFATFWQSVVIYMIPNLDTEQKLLWSDFLLTVEMIPFAILLNYAFPYHEMVAGLGTMSDKRVLDNVKDLMSVKDVIQDAYHNFMPSYQDYVVARDDHDAPPKTFRTKTFLVGNLDAAHMHVGKGGGGGGAGLPPVQMGGVGGGSAGGAGGGLLTSTGSINGSVGTPGSATETGSLVAGMGSSSTGSASAAGGGGGGGGGGGVATGSRHSFTGGAGGGSGVGQSSHAPPLHERQESNGSDGGRIGGGASSGWADVSPEEDWCADVDIIEMPDRKGGMVTKGTGIDGFGIGAHQSPAEPDHHRKGSYGV